MTNVIRVIPRLDIKGPNLIKGIQFDCYRVLGTPEYFAEHYYNEGADELIYHDAVASLYRRNSLLPIIRKTARKIFIPLTVAGGIRSVEDVKEILRAGADKVAINTAAVERPELLREASRIFGSQCIISSIEAHRNPDGRYEAWVDYGRQPTGLDVFDWARTVVDLGVGEILLTGIHTEGMGGGYDLELTSRVAEMVPVPVIASGGAGRPDHMVEAVKSGKGDAVSAASLFHYHYARRPDTMWMSYDRKELRMGAQVDSGNIDFLKEGYGGMRDLMVEPASLPEVKDEMARSGLRVRRVASVSKVESAVRGESQ